MWDDDEPKPKPRRIDPIPLEPLGVAELREYITEMQIEIVRVESAITSKEGHKGAAERFFRT